MSAPQVQTKPAIVIVRDGWGRNPNAEHDAFNAVKLASTPRCDALLKEYPWTLIRTSGGDVGLPSDLTDYLDVVANVSALPVCAGFGIRTADDVVNVGEHASGAIVGSALVEVLERGEDPTGFLQALR